MMIVSPPLLNRTPPTAASEEYRRQGIPYSPWHSYRDSRRRLPPRAPPAATTGGNDLPGPPSLAFKRRLFSSRTHYSLSSIDDSPTGRLTPFTPSDDDGEKARDFVRQHHEIRKHMPHIPAGRDSTEDKKPANNKQAFRRLLFSSLDAYEDHDDDATIASVRDELAKLGDCDNNNQRRVPSREKITHAIGHKGSRPVKRVTRKRKVQATTAKRPLTAAPVVNITSSPSRSPLPKKKLRTQAQHKTPKEARVAEVPRNVSHSSPEDFQLVIDDGTGPDPSFFHDSNRPSSSPLVAGSSTAIAGANKRNVRRRAADVDCADAIFPLRGAAPRVATVSAAAANRHAIRDLMFGDSVSSSSDSEDDGDVFME